MARRFLDDDLRVWEAFLNPSSHGEGDALQVVFRCVSDPRVPSRAGEAGERSAVSESLRTASDVVLRETLGAARPLS